METQQGSGDPAPRPTPEEARLALREAQQARSSLDSIPVPGWYFPVLALMIAGITLSQLLPSFAGLAVVIVMIAGTGAMVGLYVNKIGVRPRISEVKGRLAWPPAAAVLLVSLAAFVLDQGYGQDWGWIVAAVANAGLILGYGLYLRRHLRKPA
ncbi:hypothetical protein [Streptosporangium lutulentum]|uniref:Amino acid permease n=1 Tax=Streptosporangium lutulentum TaxID=1461250 RepID=A0ABT9QM23_9ACTN|nr:hypothetical protein [Streptosporangium lutulentum]MDP9847430.1 hypothetical protein [Streptosporangium lutulentum]